MKRRFTVPCRAVPRALVLAVCVALIPLPVAAGESQPPSKPSHTETAKSPESGTLRAAIEKVDLRDLKMPAKNEPVRRSAQGTDPIKQSSSFFKTGTGITVLAIAAAGVAYALYSTSHDRIHSPGRN